MADSELPAEQVIRVSYRNYHTFYVNQVKQLLLTYDTVELQGLEDAIAILVRSAEMLCSLGYTTMGTFITNTIEEPDRNNNVRRRTKATIRLTKASSFDKAYQEHEVSRKKQTNN